MLKCSMHVYCLVYKALAWYQTYSIVGLVPYLGLVPDPVLGFMPVIGLSLSHKVFRLVTTLAEHQANAVVPDPGLA